MNKKLFIAITVLTCLTPSISFAPPKKKPLKSNTNPSKEKKEDLNKLFKDFEKQVKEDVKKNTEEKEKEVQSQTLQLLKKEFALRKDKDESFQVWCANVQKLLEHQKECLEIGFNIAKLLLNEKQITNDYFSSWGPCATLKGRVNNSSVFNIKPNCKSPKANILILRYMTRTNRLHIHMSNFELTSDDIKFLEQNKKGKNKEIKMVSNAILKTIDYNNYKKAKQRLIDQEKLLRETLLIQQLPECNLSENFLVKWFGITFSIAEKRELIKEKHLGPEGLNDGYFKELYQYHTQILNESKDLINLFNVTIENNSKKKLDITSKKIETKKEIIEYDTNIIEEKSESLEEEKKEEKNSNTEIFFKSNIEKNAPFHTILPRVSDWFSNVSEAYESHINAYNKISSKKDCELMVKYHTFSQAVDLFIESLAIKCDWVADGAREGDMSYNIPGQIIYNTKDEENKTVQIITTGVFSYGVSKDKSLFHRCFSERSYDAIKSEIAERVERGEHPASNFSLTMSKKDIEKEIKLKPVNLENYQNYIKENSFYIEINDKPNDMIIRLFKTK